MKIGQTLSANLQPTRPYDAAPAAPLTDAMTYDGSRSIATRPSFATRTQRASDGALRKIPDRTPLSVIVPASDQERPDGNQATLDFVGTAYNQWREARPDAGQHPGDGERVQLHCNVAFSSRLRIASDFWLRRNDAPDRRLSGRFHIVRNQKGQASRRLNAFAGNDDRTRIEERLEEQPASRAANGLDNDRLQRVLDYIAANVTSDLTLEKLAAISCYSVFHFARKFTLAMGISPQRYVAHLRLENAMAELRAGKSSLVEIALNASFSSQASFTRAFRRATGTTPSAYKRRRHGNTANA